MITVKKSGFIRYFLNIVFCEMQVKTGAFNSFLPMIFLGRNSYFRTKKTDKTICAHTCHLRYFLI